MAVGLALGLTAWGAAAVWAQPPAPAIPASIAEVVRSIEANPASAPQATAQAVALAPQARPQIVACAGALAEQLEAASSPATPLPGNSIGIDITLRPRQM